MRKAALLLLCLGMLQMAGDLLRWPALRAIAAATAASPAPKVFSSVRGLETYSTRFFVEWTDTAGNFHSVEITPGRAAGLRGPYNRRNIYGAVLAYGPVMEPDQRTRLMFDSVARFALCGNAPLLRELGIDPGEVDSGLRVRLEPRPGAQTGTLPLSLEAPCS